MLHRSFSAGDTSDAKICGVKISVTCVTCNPVERLLPLCPLSAACSGNNALLCVTPHKRGPRKGEWPLWEEDYARRRVSRPTTACGGSCAEMEHGELAEFSEQENGALFPSLRRRGKQSVRLSAAAFPNPEGRTGRKPGTHYDQAEQG